jgi:hypothetical protein
MGGASIGMMRVLVFVATVVGTCAAWASAAPGLTEREAPRATDLLRAKQMAERTQSRLRLPREPMRGWQRGGGGWNAPPKPATREPRVVVNVGPTRRPAPRRTTVE